MNRAKILLFSFGALLLLVLTFVDFPPQKKNVREQSKRFYETTIAGTLVHIGIWYHGTSITVNNGTGKFLFYPYANKTLNEGNAFRNIAEPGDSVLKNAYSDSLILIKSGKRYYYRFQQIKQ